MTPDNTGYPPPSTPPAATLGQVFQRVEEEVILLSCFDGIGSAALILKGLVADISLHIAWEVDSDCLEVLKARHPEAVIRGDFLKDDPAEVARAIHRHDPEGTKLVLFASAPPCPDFSRIRDDAPGSAGEEGQKFTAYCEFIRKVEMDIPHKRTGHITENVVMDKGEADHFAGLLDCNTVLADAQDFGLINRPRLWWTRVDWSRTRTNPITGKRLRWSKNQKYHRLHHDTQLQEETDLQLDGLRLHTAVATHDRRMPCLTTPAPSDDGRPAPKKLRGKIDPEQKARWLQDGRSFAPWQYSPEALLHAADGSMTVPPPEAKEQLHQLPRWYTAVPGVSERARHRMLANGWHIGSAKFIMMLVLQSMLMTAAATPAPQPRHTAMQTMLNILQPLEPQIGPGRWPSEAICVAQTGSMWEHWKAAIVATHPMQRPPRLEPGLQQCADLRNIIGGSLPRMRSEIVDEIEQMASDWADGTTQWWESLPHHVAQVYFNKDHNQISQIPLLLHLLRLVRMPGLDDLSDDLQRGFKVTGELHAGSGWLPRTDSRYEFPVTSEAFLRNNRQYTTRKLLSKRVDPEWATMQDELRTELAKGRMSGPYRAPDWWPVPTTTIDDMPLRPLPSQEISTSFCFSVVQSDKIRRCEDFRRSGHNATVIAHDVPHHHDIRTFTELALATPPGEEASLVWAQDLDGAYRQFPVRDPTDCYCVLMTPGGPVLLQHHAMTFGAVSSVWNFNRAADSIMFLSRRLLGTPLGHYVDDFIGVEPAPLVQSGFSEFTRLMRTLGLRMKERKALAPAAQQKVLGIIMHIKEDKIILSPHPDRCQRACKTIQTALDTNMLSSDLAHRLAGKLVFLTSTLFGQLGKAALQPLYARAHGLSEGDHSGQLNGPLRSALLTLRGLLQVIKPREILRQPNQPVVVIYSDAYFVIDGQTHSPGSSSIPKQWLKTKCHTYENGWGFVIHFCGRTLYSAGRVPPWLIKRFCTRKAFIYFLEVAAQFLGFLLCRQLKSSLVLSFIDNTSGFFALRKGYCKDPSICNMIALVWRIIAHDGWHLHLEWVPSGMNISDQVSRHQFKEMAELEAEWVEVDTANVYRILHRVATDHQYAHGQALQDVLNLQYAPMQTSHTGRVGELAPVWRETAPEVTLAEQSQQLSQRTPTASKRCSESGLAFEQF